MKLLPAILFAGGVLCAQGHGSRAAGGVVFANPSGYGNVAFPGTGTPQPPASFATSLGYAVSGQFPVRNSPGAGRRNSVGYGGVGYAYPVIVGGGGGYGAGYYDQGPYAPQQQPNITIINNPPAPAGPAVIINQNYAAPQEPVDSGPGDTVHVFQPAARQQEPATDAAAPHYFLIAYKDHSVYSALAYWVEDKTMHYVTPQQTHNQASLDLIDMEFTKKLNQR